MTRHLRAAAATVLVAGGATMLDVQAHLGHASAETTMRHYVSAQGMVRADPAVRSVSGSPGAALGTRIDRLWAGFVAAHGDPLKADWNTF